jgi:hypothetical protein
MRPHLSLRGTDHLWDVHNLRLFQLHFTDSTHTATEGCFSLHQSRSGFVPVTACPRFQSMDARSAERWSSTQPALT